MFCLAKWCLGAKFQAKKNKNFALLILLLEMF